MNGRQRYAILDKWYPIGPEVTLESLKKLWIRPERKTPIPSKEVEVLSSNGSKKYKVTIGGLRNTCTCTGFGYRGKCSHIETAILELSEK